MKTGLKNNRKTAVIAALGLITAITVFSGSGLTGELSSSTLINDGEQPRTATTSDTSTSTSTLNDGLKAYYRFDNVKASRGYSIELDGSDDYLQIPSSDSLNTTGAITVSGWAKFDTTGQSSGLFGRGIYTGSCKGLNPYFIRLNESGSQLVWSLGKDTSCGNFGSRVTDSFSYETGKWYHIAGVWNGSTAPNSQRLYVDGTKVAQGSPGFSNLYKDNTYNVIGYGEQHLDGEVDNVRVYERALSSKEINNLYKGLPVSRNNLILYQRFNEGPNNCDLTTFLNCLEDESTNKNNAEGRGIEDNNLDTGSGWTKETPVNRPSAEDTGRQNTIFFEGGDNEVFFEGGNNGELMDFDFNASSGWTADSKVGEKALKLDGVDDIVRVRDNPDLDFNQEITASVWFKPLEGGNGSTDRSLNLISKRWGGGGYTDIKFELGYNSANQITWTLGVNDEVELLEMTSSETVTPETGWHHAAGTYNTNTNTARIFIDGSMVKEISYTADNITSISTDDMYIGGGDIFNDRYYLNGSIDDARLYSTSLSPSEIQELYNGEPVNDGLVGRWNFESGDGETAYDTYYKSSGVLGGSSIDSGPETYGSGGQVSMNESTVSAWYSKGDLPEKVSSTGRRYATFCLLDTSDDQGLFSIGSTRDGNFIQIQNLSTSGDVVHTRNNTLNRGELWRFPCDDYGPDSAFRINAEYPVSVDYDSMLDARTSDDDWTSRAGEDIWFSMPNDNNEMSITAYRNNTEVTLYNRKDETSQSFTLDKDEFWTCSDCTNSPTLFNIKTNENHPVTVLYGKFDDNSGSEIVAPTRKLYRVSKDYAENGQKIHIAAEKDNTDVDITDYAGNCTTTSTTLNAGEVYSDSCGQGTINLKVNSSKPVSLTLIEAGGDYGPSMYRSSTNNWGIGKEYSITSSNDQGNSISLISLADNNQIDISGSFSYSAELDKYENRYGVGNLPVNEYLKIEAEHPVAVVGDAGSNYEAAMAVLPLPKMNIVEAGESGIGVSKDRTFGFSSGNIISTEGLRTDQWQNLVMTGGSSTSLYIDGRKALNTDISSSAEKGKIRIGRAPGKIDEVRVYDRSLSDSEVQDLLFQ
ncbi:LamG-like jellyroll fold domain-containing protein [Candidatus Nanohalovita haloferacivicina]|uniref:LamG-like jellyroll fold domain-containing protein n=1 Tax=Candidatus Nanohalovita haloferacivicina TaxID=2978046 RepID=UPI00325FAA75|nr:LamG domain-containing protein [Candidatus Nanohalobia archaeon BNXNv]